MTLIDDSRQREAIQAHRGLLADHAKATGATVRHVGADQAADVVERLVKARPEAADAARDLLLPRSGIGFGGGRGYNLALLLAAGGRMALLDDDYRLPFHRARGAGSGIEVQPWTPFPVRFEADLTRVLAAGESLSDDGLAMQIGLVGVNFGQVQQALPDLRVRREQLRGLALARLAHLRGDARVLATYTGTRGASFTSDSTWLYDLDPASRAAFWLDRESYLRNVHAETVEYAPAQVTPRPFGLFTPFVLDDSRLLPCTAPTGRGEDGLFGVVGSYLYPDSLTLHLPLTIAHVQEQRRPRFDRARQALTPGINRFLREWVRNQAQPALSADPGERLILLAAQLEDLAGAPVAARIAMLDEYLRYARADLIEHIQQQLLSAPDAPVYWAADARQIVEANAKALLAATPPRLDEWPADISAADCAEKLRQACLELANGYRHWPALWHAAAELGERLLPSR